jgi:hypothetical protein
MYSDPHSPDAVVPQELFPYYLNHNNVVELASHYTANANTAATYSKPFIMFEMNTGSCGGFPGISDTYTAALWALDYGLQMASQNTTHALLHVGGQNVFYNVSGLWFSVWVGRVVLTRCLFGYFCYLCVSGSICRPTRRYHTTLNDLILPWTGIFSRV